MITADLISYIKKQKEKNIPKALIFSKLLKAGWIEEDIDEGFEKVEKENSPKVLSAQEKTEEKPKDINSLSDKYREPFEGDPIAKTEIPTSLKPILNTEIKKTEKDTLAEGSGVIFPKEENIKKEETQKIIPVFFAEAEKEKEIQPVQVFTENKKEVVVEKKEDVSLPDVYELELPAGVDQKQNKTEDKDYSGVLIPKAVPVKETVENIVAEDILAKEEQSPVLENPKELNLGEDVKKTIDIKEEGLFEKGSFVAPDVFVNNGITKEDIQTANEEMKKDYSMENLPKIASVNTLSQDLQKMQEQGISTVDPVKRKETIFKVLKWIAGASVFVGLAFAGWLIYRGDIRINIPFIKKDPRALILENSKILSSLESYKSDTSVEIQMPSIASLTASLISGEENKSLDKDSISLNSVGKVNQDSGAFMSENNVLVKSTIMQNFINTNIKNDGQNLYVNIPDLTYLLKEKSPYPSIVKMNEQESLSVSKLFEGELGLFLGRLNVYQLLAKGVSSFIDKDSIGSYDDLISKVEITEKGMENIKGVDTYRYSVNPDKELFKKLLLNITDKFILNQNEEDRTKMLEIVSSAFVKSFDVWVGKSDNTIYQYEIVLDIPLSKILSFEDRSIGDNQISIAWKTTYFDFNKRNEIIIPDSYISTKDFIRNSKVKTIKEQLNNFGPLADDLRKVEKTFGLKINKEGSCMNPVSGSLFSPLGHLKTATIPMGQISSSLNNVLSLTSGQGLCFSDLKSWSLTVPLSEDYTSGNSFELYYCVDSTGMKKEVSSPTKGPVCE